jgi:hypothetical protein
MPTPGAWLLAFLLTFVVEAPIVVALTRASEVGVARRVALVFFAQLVTHPLVWFVFPYIVGITGGTATLLSEIWAWLAEAAFYALVLRGVTVTRAVAVSALANGASVLVGVALSQLGHGFGA